MRKLTVFLAGLCFSLGLVGTAWAHLPLDVIYYAVQFPDEFLPTMDGDLSDWDIVPDAYVQELEDMYEQLAGLGKASGLFDASDFSVRSIVGWNESTNRLYFMAEVFDDIHQTDRTEPEAILRDDYLELMIDTDHTGGQYAIFSDLTEEEEARLNQSQAQCVRFAVPPVAGVSYHISGKAAEWYFNPEYFDWGWSFTGEQLGESTYYYEISLTGWDDLNWEGPDVSDMHDLTEGEIIGLGYAFGDLDKLPYFPDAYWTVSGGDGTWFMADALADFFLSPVDPVFAEIPEAVEVNTWGRIKATFTK